MITTIRTCGQCRHWVCDEHQTDSPVLFGSQGTCDIVLPVWTVKQVGLVLRSIRGQDIQAMDCAAFEDRCQDVQTTS